MSCTEILKARVSVDIKCRALALADRDLMTPAAWLKRVLIREISAAETADARLCTAHWVGKRRPEIGHRNGDPKIIYVRLGQDDWLLLEARAAARGMRPATYLSVLTRTHLRELTPLPKDELLTLRRAIGELSAIGRNLNQIAKVANEGGRLPGSGREEFRAMLKVCEALRDSTKALLRANVVSWSTGHL